MEIFPSTANRFKFIDEKDDITIFVTFTNDNHFIYRALNANETQEVEGRGTDTGIKSYHIKKGNASVYHDDNLEFIIHIHNSFKAFFRSSEYKEHGNHAQIVNLINTKQINLKKAREAQEEIDRLS